MLTGYVQKKCAQALLDARTIGNRINAESLLGVTIDKSIQ